jgi:putative flavoprotein involved in K+ transport
MGMTEHIDVAIVGAGQAGLSLSYYLTQQGREHVLLEQGQLGESWRSRRWDSFTLNTPSWMTQLPGYSYAGDEPDRFLPRAEIVDLLERYAASFQAPVRSGVHVAAVRQQPGDAGYAVEAGEVTLAARSVVLATGAFQRPKRPPASADVSPRIQQLHTSEYRNPQALPPGAVLVVGSGQSGCQVAEDLHLAGRQVYLATSGCGRFPRRYRGHDITWWLVGMGFFDRTIAELPWPAARFACNPQISGDRGGHDINLREFARQGIRLLGHFQAAEGHLLRFAGDLQENLATSDAFTEQLTRDIDTYIASTGTQAPPHEAGEVSSSPGDSNTSSTPTTLDLDAAGVSTIIWGSGFQCDFSWVQPSITDETGYPIHQRGVTTLPGLYLLGLHLLHKRKSALLYGVGEDAAYIAQRIAERG